MKILIARSSLFLMVFIAVAVRSNEKEATLKFNKAEMEVIFDIIDNAAVPGNIRKPLLQKIQTAYLATFAQASGKDTSGKDSGKKKINQP